MYLSLREIPAPARPAARNPAETENHPVTFAEVTHQLQHVAGDALTGVICGVRGTAPRFLAIAPCSRVANR
jgi:hypothetical protein